MESLTEEVITIIKIPSVLFINCLGSYFYSIVEHLAGDGKGHALLYFLSTSRLCYQELNTDNIREKYGDNPWGYQPISIVNAQAEELKVNSSFFDYLYRMHKISVEIVDMNNEPNLLQCITEHIGQGLYNIFNVDEFYISESKDFFRKTHNKHFLLVEEADRANETLLIIDSENNEKYSVTYREMEKAVYSSIYNRKLCYRINGCDYKDGYDKYDLLRGFLSTDNSCGYISQLVQDMEKRLYRNDVDVSYFFRGYYYTLLSKIQPYVQMRYKLLTEEVNSVQQISKELRNDWVNLCRFMLYKMKREDYAFTPVQRKMEAIQRKELALENIMHLVEYNL